MRLPPSPADALAELAGVLVAFENGDGPIGADPAAMIEDAIAMLDDRDESFNPWEWDPEDLYRHHVFATLNWPPHPPTTVEALAGQIMALNWLDLWHAPLGSSPEAKAKVRLDGHRDAQARLDAGQPYGHGPEGVVIPATAGAGDLRDDLEPSHDVQLTAFHPAEPVRSAPRTGLLRRTLLDTAFLPYRIPSCQGDIRLTYLRPPTPVMPPRDPNAPWRIGIAPLLQSTGDAVIHIETDRYSVEPVYAPERLSEIVDRTLAEDVELLLMPELSLSTSGLAHLQRVLKAKRDAYMLAVDVPALRYILAGVSAERATTDPGQSRHANFVVLLDCQGRELKRQDKLNRWDLEGNQIRRYDLGPINTPDDAKLVEDIALGGEVCVIDLPELGRVFTLICADANADAPGDWLFANVRADWINSPIMDGSTCWQFNESLRPFGSWITRRAHRAACAAHARVLVSNSMTLASRTNTTNARDGRRTFAEGGIGLLVDGATLDIAYGHLTAAINRSDAVLEVIDWGTAWTPYPNAVAIAAS